MTVTPPNQDKPRVNDFHNLCFRAVHGSALVSGAPWTFVPDQGMSVEANPYANNPFLHVTTMPNCTFVKSTTPGKHTRPSRRAIGPRR